MPCLLLEAGKDAVSFGRRIRAEGALAERWPGWRRQPSTYTSTPLERGPPVVATRTEQTEGRDAGAGRWAPCRSCPSTGRLNLDQRESQSRCDAWGTGRPRVVRSGKPSSEGEEELKQLCSSSGGDPLRPLPATALTVLYSEVNWDTWGGEFEREAGAVTA